ncbi:MAG: inositol monophosphatase [Deltaproteobacteria bacterium]|nr:inositol monophosphatase [Deltaproteobacteria bacterium]MBT6433250.1 inositol monophosphatase [Deltaproteobacteria bacterium]MBT6488546.1 inositol monophosphatase [Deltaproteobacteria bacterium]
MTELNSLAADAAHMAKIAGSLIRKGYDSTSTVNQKGAIDLVTDTDHAAERSILAYIDKHYADSAVLAEESGSREGTSTLRWIVDPLDGTVNFAHRIPHFCVLVAAQIENSLGAFETVVSATYDPMRDEIFLAERGQGATLNGEGINVSGKERLIDSLLTTGFGYERLFKANDNHAEYCRLNLVTRGVRRLGSAGLDLAYVAVGRFDGFWEYELNPWDQAAGQLLVSEAGGLVTQMDGSLADVDSNSILAAGTKIHSKILDVLASVSEHSVNSRDGLERFLPKELGDQLSGLDSS